MYVTNLRITDVVQSEVLNDLSHQVVLFLLVELQLETGSEGQGFGNSEVREQDIVLHDVSSVAGERFLVDGHAVVENYLSRYLGFVSQTDSVSKDIQQRSLSGSGRTHDVGGLAGSGVSRGFLNDLLASEAHSGVSLLLFGGFDFHFKAHFVEGKFDWVGTILLGVFNQLCEVNGSSVGQGIGTDLSVRALRLVSSDFLNSLSSF